MTRAVFALLVALALGACGPRPVVLAPDLEAAAGRTAPQSGLHADLDAIFNAPQFNRAIWSVLVRRAESGDPLYSVNAARLVMPGSTLKLITAAAAAEHLGWDHRFETRLVSLSPVESGVVRGDLFVIGGGDPAISERSDAPGTLGALARQVRQSGITRIEGAIVGHDDVLDDKAFGDGWTLDNMPYGYAAPVSALMYNEGSVDLVIRAGATAGEPVAVDVRPEGSGLQIDNRLVTVDAAGTGMLTLQRLPGSSHLIVKGQIPAGAPAFVRTASVDNPTRFFAAAFRHALLAEGVEVVGEAIDFDDYLSKPDLASAQIIFSHSSPPLSQLVTSMMSVSQNQYAELLLKSIGGRPTVQRILESWDVPEGSYILADGSGLSRYNYVASETIVRVLDRMQASGEHGSAFVKALPVAGRDGTLARRLTGTPAEGRVRAKTGTIDNVRGIAGYVQTAGGDVLVFSIIANNFSLPNSAIDAAADRALIRLATHTR